MQIELRQVSVHFQDRKTPQNKVIAVDKIDMLIPDGKLVCLLGPSGCGKSTTLYAIAGLQPLNEGHIFFGERDVTQLDAVRREIGLVFQNYALYPHMTVRQNIIFPLQNAKWSKERIARRVDEVARTVQLESLLDRKPSQLSGGQQQRVAIARAIAKEPKILLMDEPLSNLDAKLRVSTREEIRHIQRATGITTIYVTHDQEEAMSISDEVAIMRDGRLLQNGPPQDVYENPLNLFVATFIGSPTMNVLPGRVAGGRVLYGTYSLGETRVADCNIMLGVRPEAVTPLRDSSTQDGVPAIINQVELLGREILYHLLLDNKTVVKMITSATERLDTKSPLRVGFTPGRRYIFATDGDQTLLERY
ncbi:MAG: ABC transporter ATP-binding protein [Symbiobacteriaceae bacterium]|nr:ABC transporter ATP-binding protein [Symbiobacteriaceae bacterium]